MEQNGLLHALQGERALCSYRIGRPQGRFWRFGEDEMHLLLPEIKPQFLSHPALKEQCFVSLSDKISFHIFSGARRGEIHRQSYNFITE
jgi:hypothetical protein